MLTDIVTTRQRQAAARTVGEDAEIRRLVEDVGTVHG